MKMPNLASSYHAGERYFSSDVQSLRNGPWSAAFATRSRMAFRCGANFALACCHASLCAAGDKLSAVGAVADCASTEVHTIQPANRAQRAAGLIMVACPRWEESGR